MNNVKAFTPDWISPPGDTILDILEERGWSQAEFAERMGYTKKHINQLILGKAPISDETASKLELVLGGKAGFWLSREAQYREAILKRDEVTLFSQYKDWLKEIPISEMIRFGWINKKTSKGDLVIEALRFFGVATVDAWRSSYAKPILAFKASDKFKKKPGAVAAWLRYGEKIAESKALPGFNAAILKKNLSEIRKLSKESESEKFLPELYSILNECGIILVIAPAPKGCPVSGLTKWISASNVLLMLSLRHKANDHFWFVLFHEIGHILKHRKKMLYLEIEKGFESETEEIEANEFARDILIPSRFKARILSLQLTKETILTLSEELDIAPGIIVGRLQKEERLTWNTHLNSLKVYYHWEEAMNSEQRIMVP